MSIKVPYHKKNDIEMMAYELLGKYQVWKKKPLIPPIDVDEIIEGFLQITLELCDLKEHLSIPDVLGATWFDEKVIRIDSSLEGKEGRLSFTMAHEVGHWYIHRPIYEMGKITVPLFGYGQVPPSAAIVCRANGPKEPAEWQADQFAAMLLTPANLLRASVLSLTGGSQLAVEGFESYIDRPVQNPFLRKAAKSIIEAAFKNVSIEAMCYRLIDLKLVVDTNPSQAALL
jgi:Zn-dependent peptidase ImmA (M78 family)